MLFKLFEDVVCAVLDPIPDLLDSAANTFVRGVDHLESGIEYARENPVKTTLGVAAVAATGGALAAGSLAAKLGGAGLLGTTATTGTTISTLSGAALKSASLAKLGGGALAAGGGGMATGTVTVASTCGAVGGAATAVATK